MMAAPKMMTGRARQKEDGDEGDGRKPDHGPGLERALADTQHGFEHDGEHGSLEAKEKRGKDRKLP